MKTGTPKYFLYSKTLIFNVIMLVLGILPLLAEVLKVTLPASAAVIDMWVAFVIGVGNLVIRIFFTEGPITFKKP